MDNSHASIHHISASAGAGKTYTITQRFLALLAQSARQTSALPAFLQGANHVPQWSTIFALTFTNKAAEEMRQRLLLALKNIALGKETDAEWTQHLAQDKITQILQHFSSLNIKTIDSLLTQLLRLNSLQLGLQPDFSPAFSMQEILTPLYKDFLEQCLTNPAQQALLDSALSEIARNPKNTAFVFTNGLTEKLTKLFQLQIELGQLPDTPCEKLHAIKDTACKQILQHITAITTALATENLNAAKNFTTFLDKARIQLQDKQTLLRSVYSSKNSIDECLNKASQGNASPQLEKEYLDFVAHWQQAERTIHLVNDAVHFAPFIALSKPLLANLHVYHMENSCLSQPLIPLLVQNILTADHTSVSENLYRLGTELSSFLIDEFQDTSRVQWAALLPLAEECLANAGQVIFVGDIKQAIYAWRGGDSSLFNEAPNTPALQQLSTETHNKTLEYNWRSAPVLVEHNNTFFGQLQNPQTAQTVLASMLKEHDGLNQEYLFVLTAGTQTLATAFTKAEQKSPEKHLHKQGYCKHVPLYAETTTELDELVYKNLHTILFDDLAHRPYSDIAILVRKNSQAQGIAQQLLEWNIPVLTEQSLAIADHPLIKQLFALLSCLEYPDDNQSFWALVNPYVESRVESRNVESRNEESQAQPHFCLLEAIFTEHSLSPQTVKEFFLLAQQKPHSLSLLFKELYPQVWEAIFLTFYSQASFLNVYDTTNELLRMFQISERFPTEKAYLERFLEAIFLFQTSHDGALANFLDYWLANGSKEQLPAPEGLNAIKILTIHKAKGLQFPVVIVPFQHDSITYTDPILCTIEGIEVLVPASPYVGAEYYEKLLQTALGQLNLLYVAWTRAEEELYTFLTCTKKSQKNSLAQAIHAIFSASFSTSLSTSSSASFSTNPPQGFYPESERFFMEGTTLEFGKKPTIIPKSIEPPIESLTTPACVEPLANWQPMYWLPRLKVLTNPVTNTDTAATLRGSFIHTSIENLSFTGNQQQDIQCALQTALLAQPETVITERDWQALTWFYTQPQVQTWLTQGLLEQGFMLATGKEYRADCLFMENTHCTIIDFKTGEESKEYLQQIETYKKQLMQTKSLAQSSFSGVIVYLDSQKIDTFYL